MKHAFLALASLTIFGCAPVPKPATESVSLAPSVEPVAAPAASLGSPNPFPDCASPIPKGTHPKTASDGGPWNVDEVISRNRFRLKLCYQRGLDEDPQAGGTVQLAVTIGPGGVADVSVHCANIRPPSLATCVISAYKSMTFQDPMGGSAAFVVPNVFSAKKVIAGTNVSAP